MSEDDASTSHMSNGSPLTSTAWYTSRGMICASMLCLDDLCYLRTTDTALVHLDLRCPKKLLCVISGMDYDQIMDSVISPVMLPVNPHTKAGVIFVALLPRSKPKAFLNTTTRPRAYVARKPGSTPPCLGFPTFCNG